MSKHPIPDWLRSQFSLIEDEVRKLGPCGVFTQMRTVTQTYFEQQAEAPQPPVASPVKVAFNTLSYGAKFKYAPEHRSDQVFVKIGHDTIAAWDERLVSSSWLAQGLFSFADDETDLTKDVYLVRDECITVAPQPPALGGEPHVVGYMPDRPDGDPLILLEDFQAHLAPLQAETEQLKSWQEAVRKNSPLLIQLDQLKSLLAEAIHFEVGELDQDSWEDLRRRVSALSNLIQSRYRA